jgi:hypothetical protein
MNTEPSAVIASEAKQSIGTAKPVTMDCFVAELVIGRRFAPTRWLLAMTEDTGNDEGYMSARGYTPTPTLPRKSGRGSAASSCFPLPLAGEGGARVSARRVGARATSFCFRIGPRCAPSGMTTI